MTSKILDAYNKVLSDGTASAVNSSFSGCDTNDTSFITSSNAIAQQGAAEGVTFAGSSGDQGVECYNGGYIVRHRFAGERPVFRLRRRNGVGRPARCTNSCSTRMIPTTPIANPVVWNDCVGAGGGGVSTQWPLPSYQSGLTTRPWKKRPRCIDAGGRHRYLFRERGRLANVLGHVVGEPALRRDADRSQRGMRQASLGHLRALRQLCAGSDLSICFRRRDVRERRVQRRADVLHGRAEFRHCIRDRNSDRREYRVLFVRRATRCDGSRRSRSMVAPPRLRR